MKIKELKIKSKEELQQALKTAREHFRELKFDLASKKLKKVRELRDARKLIAKILTLINEKENDVNAKVISKKNTDINKKDQIIK